MGGVDIDDDTSLADVRELITEEIDARLIPRHYVFMYKGAPVSANQEHKRYAIHCFPDLQLRVRACTAPSKGSEGAVTVLFSTPLVFLDEHRRLQSLPKISYNREKDIIYSALCSPSTAIRTQFDFATSDTLRDAVSGACQCLHYSGHATSTAIVLEDGYGGAHLLSLPSLSSLLCAASGSLPDLVFVAACSSKEIGTAFVNAGVQHVVAIESNVDLRDQAATVFTSAFYKTLAKAKSVGMAFQIAKESVKSSPCLTARDADNFLLLPEDGDHSTIIFPLDALDDTERDLENEREIESRQEGRDDEDSDQCRFLAPLPPPPEGFVGRAIDVYEVVSNICRNRLVSLCGVSGIGLTAVVIAAANYVAEHNYMRHGVVFLELTEVASSSSDIFVELLQQLRLTQETSNPARDVITYLYRRKVLIVIDSFDPEQREHVDVVSQLLQKTRYVSVLLSSEKPLGARSVQFGAAEKVHWLEPLQMIDAARLFLKRAPRTIAPDELGVSNYSELLVRLSCHPMLTSFQGIPSRIVEAAADAHKPLQLADDLANGVEIQTIQDYSNTAS